MTLDDELPDIAWGYLPYINGPFTWAVEDCLIYDRNNSIVQTAVKEQETVDRWNAKYAEWLMVKPNDF